MVECPTCGDEFSEHGVTLHHGKAHGEKYYAAIIRQEFGTEPEEWLTQKLRVEKKPLADVAETLGTTASTVQGLAESLGVETLSYSEASEVRWERADEEDRSKMLSAAHEKTREMVESGEHNFQDEDFERVLTDEFWEQAEGSGVPDELVKWRKENPEKIEEFASRGAEAREENGMAGATGQDNPNWRGGKSVYDAVKKQLGNRSWNYLQDHERTDECYNCGAKSGQHDLHHIIPIMAGGTNESWNLMTLCDSCHRKAELFIREYDEFSPVLVE